MKREGIEVLSSKFEQIPLGSVFIDSYRWPSKGEIENLFTEWHEIVLDYIEGMESFKDVWTA